MTISPLYDKDLDQVIDPEDLELVRAYQDRFSKKKEKEPVRRKETKEERYDRHYFSKRSNKYED